MIIKSIHVKRFRSLFDETLDCDYLTALVGPNGAGKSSFLRALDLFYLPTPKFVEEDFYDENTEEDIEIAVTFGDLGPKERERFAGYINYEQLTVVRVLSLTEGKRSANYHGSRLRNPEFGEVRDASAAAEIKARYKVLRQKPEYADELPPASTKDNVVAALEEWESQHPQSCMRMRDDGQFFGFTGVGRGYLGQYTKFLLIPAVREAGADASEGKGSPITELMDLLVRGVLAEREDVSNLRRELQEKYEEVLRPTKENELSQLESDLTGGLQTYVPDAEVRLSWEKTGGIEVPLPRAAVKLVEDGYQASVERTGHGLQRAFILTLLQQLAAAQDRKGVPPREERPGPSAQGQSSEKDAMPNLLLGIEEPELFQHPSRQRHLAKIFQSLTRGEVQGVAHNTQVLYATHAPLFVGLDCFDQVRVLRKVALPGF